MKNVLGYIDTEQYSYGELCNEINIHTGDIVSSVNTYVNAKKLDEYKLTFEVKTKAMYDELPVAFALMTEIMTASKFTDESRILEILEELKSIMQANLLSSGHTFAAVRAMSYFSETAAVSELVNGLPCYRMLEQLTENFDANKKELVAKLEELAKCIFRPENLLVDITATEEGFACIKDLVPSMKAKLFTVPVKKELLQFRLLRKTKRFLPQRRFSMCAELEITGKIQTMRTQVRCVC